jgi:D-alanyl-D-alanine carboxypeptidase/D-alanyl-D-alanine-endopeptidase (penicillin-binding protein 4)
MREFKFRAFLARADDVSSRMSTRRLLISWLLVTVVIAVPLLSVWQVALAAGDEVRPLKNQTPLAQSPATPVLSARRVPQTLIDLISAGRVQGKLNQVVAALPRDSCLVVITDGRAIIEVNPTGAVVPGSNQKLLTGAVALDVLGPDRRFTTKLLGIVSGSVVRGDLWLVGSGDPLLTTRTYPMTEKYPTMTPTDVEQLVDALVSLGIKSIEGGVVGDESVYDRERYVPSWGDGIRSVEAGPLGALMINDGSISGSPLKPANPAFAAASEFTKLLTARGITVRDSPDIGESSIDTPTIATLESAPMSEIVLVGNGAGTRVDGLTVIANKISEWGLPGAGVALLDASGLDRGNLLTCRLLTELLQRDGKEGLVTTGMALAGKTGTLRDVFLTGPGSGTMRAKTGTLNGVKSLSGVMPLDDGRASYFSLIMNGSGVSTVNFYRPIWNNLASALAFGDARIDVNKLLPVMPSSQP